MASEQSWLINVPGLHIREPDEMSDTVLAARSDADSFMRLYQRYFRPVYRYLYARIGNQQDAEDLTTMVFEKAWICLRSYQGTGSFKAWLFTIAYRVLVEHYRRKKPDSVPVDTLSNVLLHTAAGPEETVLVSEQIRQLMQIITELSPDQQQVISLRFMAELSYAEIAQIMRKQEPAVKMMAYRTLEEIRRRYRDVY